MRAGRRQVESADAYFACQLPWQWFVTLTWMGEFSRAQHIAHVVFWIKEVRELFALKGLGYLVRWEHGGVGGKLHAHLLMYGWKPEQYNSASARYMSVLWRLRGLAKVRKVAGSDVSYTLKNAYETARFGRTSEAVYWNATAWGLLCELRGVSSGSTV